MNEAFLTISGAGAQVVVAGLWQGCLVALAVGLSLRVLPRISAAQRFAVWLATFAIAISLPFVSFMHHATAPGVLHVAPLWSVALAGLWFATFTVRLGLLLAEALRVRKIWRNATPVLPDASIAGLLAACKRSPRLYLSDDVTAPSVIGFLSPRLLIPVSLMPQLTEPELRQIVLHECEHLRRYDDWLNLLQKFALAVFPLNLALVWVDRRLGLERELACDAGVVGKTGAPLDYAACLARLAEHRMGGSRVALALSAWARRSELARRVYTLLAPVRNISALSSRAAITGLACMLAAGAVELSKAPELLSFASPLSVAAVVEPRITLAQGFTATPVVYHVAARRTSPPAPHRATFRRVQKRAASPAVRPRMFLTAARPQPAPAGLVEVRFAYSYAAVPFGDGWLIVQL